MGSVEKVAAATYFAKALGDDSALPVVRCEMFPIWAFLWNWFAATITSACPASKVSSIAQRKSALFRSTSLALTPKASGR